MAHTRFSSTFRPGFDCTHGRATIIRHRIAIVAGFGAGDSVIAADRGDANIARTAHHARAVHIGVARLAIVARRANAATAVDIGFRAVLYRVVAGGCHTRLSGAYTRAAVRTGQTLDAYASTVAELPRSAVRTARTGKRIRVCRYGTVARIVRAGIVVVTDVGRLGDHLRGADAVTLYFLTISGRLVCRWRTNGREVCFTGTTLANRR